MKNFFFTLIALSMLCVSVASAQVTINTDATWKCFPLPKPASNPPYGSTAVFSDPPSGWKTTYNAGWANAVGTGNIWAALPANPTNATYVWAAGFQKKITLTAGNIAGFHTMTVTVNNGCDIWVNNNFVGNANWMQRPNVFCIPSSWLVAGDNLIAVKAFEYLDFASSLNISATFGQGSSVSVKSNSPVCVGSFINLTTTVTGAVTGLTYKWTGPNGYTSTAQNPVIANVTAAMAGVYTLETKNAAGCTQTTTTTVAVTAFTPTVTGNTSICSGNSTVLTASGGGTYKWSNNATTAAITVTTAGTYTVTVTSANGCSSSTSKTVTVGTQPFLDIIGNRFVCQGSASSLSAVPIVTGSVYTWKFNGQIISGTALSIPATLVAGTYSVTQSVVNAQGCTRTNVFDVIVYPKPRINLTNLSVTCNGKNANVTINIATVGGRPAYTYKWSNGATTQNLTVVNSSVTTYSVTVTDANGCTDVRTFDCMSPCAANTVTTGTGMALMSNGNKPLTEVTPEKTPLVTSETDKSIGMQIFPNPAKTFARVTYQLPKDANTAFVVVYDMFGREVYRAKVEDTEGQVAVSTQGWAAATYLYNLVADGKIISSQRLVVVKE